MTTLREAAQMALDALYRFVEYDYQGNPLDGKDIEGHDAIEALRAAQAAKEPEPVAYWRHTSSINQGWDEFGATRAFDDDIPLYTAPPQREWQGLTDEEIADCEPGNVEGMRMLPYSFARAIEAKLKEKNS